MSNVSAKSSEKLSPASFWHPSVHCNPPSSGPVMIARGGDSTEAKGRDDPLATGQEGRGRAGSHALRRVADRRARAGVLRRRNGVEHACRRLRNGAVVGRRGDGGGCGPGSAAELLLGSLKPG